jgi:hypothetical protein
MIGMFNCVGGVYKFMIKTKKLIYHDLVQNINYIIWGRNVKHYYYYYYYYYYYWKKKKRTTQVQIFVYVNVFVHNVEVSHLRHICHYWHSPCQIPNV